MSSIAKPHLFFSTAVPAAAQDILVPVDHVLNISKVDVPAFGSTPAKKQIKVVLIPQVGGSVMDFTFADASARNTAFTAAKTLLAASV